MCSDVSISVSGVSKCYQVYSTPQDRLKQFLLPRLARIAFRQPRQYFKEFWALNDINFEVKRGETIGIIGRNGSGKSTLLQIICGTLSPTGGQVETTGRVGALLELGAGFNPEFTGRDNVYLNASILGLSQAEIDAAYDSIVAFADIGEFIDQPVKTYSSGMTVRLAFAVQANLSPDILIVDEALAVGDAKFQAKCFDHLARLKKEGTSILLVTHSSEQIVTHCSRAILIESGEILQSGEPRDVVNRYQDLLFGKSSGAGKELPPNAGSTSVTAEATFSELSRGEDRFSTHEGYNPHEYRWGDKAARFLDYRLSIDDTEYPSVIDTGASVKLSLSIRFDQKIDSPIIGMTIKTKEGVTVYGTNSEVQKVQSFSRMGKSGTNALVDILFTCDLAPGDYFISIGLATKAGEEVVPHDRRYDSIHFQVSHCASFFGLVNLTSQIIVRED